MSDPINEIATAFHEAGHAVAANAVGYKVTSVTVGDFPETRHQMPVWDADPSSGAGRSRQLVVTLAGRSAEALLLYRPELASDESLDEEYDDYADILDNDGDEGLDWEDGDGADAFKLLIGFDRDSALSEMKHAQADARELIREHWQEVVRLAAKLMQDGSVTDPWPDERSVT